MNIANIKYWQIAAELFKRRDYSIQTKTPWGIHEKQLQAMVLLCSEECNSVGYGGSARSGKSWVASEWLTMNCLAYPGTGWGLARKELKNLKRSNRL